LGQVPEFYFWPELSPTERLHIRGAIKIGESDLENTRAALKAAAGSVPDNFKNKVLVMDKLRPEWFAYYENDSRVFATLLLKKRARAIYQQEA
jgi:hypothetical protein